MKINSWNEFRGMECVVLSGSRIRGIDQQNNQRLHTSFSEGKEIEFDLNAVIVHTFQDINGHIIQYMNDAGKPQIAWCYHTELRIIR